MTPSRNSPRLVSFLAVLLLSAISLLAQEPGSATEKAFNDAQQLYHDGKLPEALAAFQQFESQYNLSASVPRAIYLQGWCWTGLRKYQEAIDTFSRLVKAYPTAPIIPEAILKEADCYRELQNYPKAIGLYRHFETQYPKHQMLPQAMLGEAWTHLQQGDIQAAAEIAQKVPADLPGASFLSAKILIAKGKYDEANKILLATPSPGDNARDFYFAAEAMFDAKQYAYALACFERAQPAADLHAPVLFRIANCQQLLGHLGEATKVYRQWLENYPADPLAEQVRFALIQLLVERREMTEASKESGAFQKKYPRSRFNTDLLFLQAETLFASEQFQSALDLYQKFSVLNTNPQLAETADFRVAACFIGLHDFDHAREGFVHFLKNYPDSHLAPEAQFRIASSYRTQDPAESIELFQNFLNRWPNDPLAPEARSQRNAAAAQVQAVSPEAQLHLGQEYLAQNRLDDAEKAFNKVIATHPENTEAQLGLARIYLKLGRDNTETIMLLQQLATDSKNQSSGEAAFVLANYFFTLPGDEKENKRVALAYYLRASVQMRGPESEEAAFRTAQCQKSLGNTEAARSAFQSYLRRFPNGKLATDAKHELATL